MKPLSILALLIACLAFPVVDKAHAFSSYYAVINPAGTTLRASGAIRSARVATGRYNITFTRKVRNCSYIASLNSATPGTANALAHPHESGTIIQVSTFGPNGTAANQNFTLMVSCPPTVVVRRAPDVAVPDGASVGISLECDPGETIIGGSADLANPVTDTFVMSRPDRIGVVPEDGETFTSWRASARNPAGGFGANTMQVFALCVR